MDPILGLAILGGFPVVVMIALAFILNRRLWPDIKEWWVRINTMPEGYELYPEFNGMWKIGIRKKGR